LPDSDSTQSIALGLEYDGSQFHGWQRQQQQCSVQQCLEQGLSAVAAEPVRVVAAGRTDTGVHATGQVVSFTAPVTRDLNAWVRGTNSLTPAALSVTWAQRVPKTFHARFRATARQYLYIIREAATRPAIARDYFCYCNAQLDEAAMYKAAQILIGEHDFSAFRAAGCQSSTPVRRMHKLEVQRFSNTLVISVTANAFLQHMVRNLVGSLVMVGQGERPVDWIAELLRHKDRQRAGKTAPPQGLYLHRVYYDGDYNFPRPELPAVLSPLGQI